MDQLEKTIRKIQAWAYENDLNKLYFNKYDITTELLSEIFENSKIPVKVNLSKLSYYTQHEFIPAPKKIGLKDTLGGSRGHYKSKVVMIIWYLHILKLRGVSNQDEKRKLIYNYFSDEIPPRPVHDTPLEERIIYMYRLNKKLPMRIFELENFNIPIGQDDEIISNIPCVKVVTHWNENNNIPYYSTLFPTRNITRKEHEFLQALRKDNQFLRDEGIKAYHLGNGRVIKKHMFDLEILKRYPLRKRDDEKVSWLDLLDKNKTYEAI